MITVVIVGQLFHIPSSYVVFTVTYWVTIETNLIVNNCTHCKTGRNNCNNLEHYC